MALYSLYDDADDGYGQLMYEALKNNQPYEDYVKKYLEVFNNFMDKLNQTETELSLGFEELDTELLKVYYDFDESNINVFDALDIKTHENQNFLKIVATLTILNETICDMNTLVENKILKVLSIYGEVPDYMHGSIKDSGGDREVFISRMLGFLRSIYEVQRKLTYVIVNILQQICILFDKAKSYYKEAFKKVKIYAPLDLLGRALSLLYKIDSAINQNVPLKNDWKNFKKMLQIVKNQLGTFGTNENQFKNFEKVLTRIDFGLLPGASLKSFIDYLKEHTKNNTNPDLNKIAGIPNNKELRELFEDYMKIVSTKIMAKVGLFEETNEREQVLPLLCVFAFYKAFYKESDDTRKLWGTMWSLQKKIPCIYITGHFIAYIPEFLFELCQLPKPKKTLDPKDSKAFLKDWITKKLQSFSKDLNDIYLNYTPWLIKVQSIISSNASLKNEEKLGTIFQYRSKILQSGILLANQISQIIKTTLFIQLREGMSFSKSYIQTLSLALEMLKSIQKILNQKEAGFGVHVLIMLNYRNLWELIQPYTDKIGKTSKMDAKNEVFAAFKLTQEQCVKPPSRIRLFMLNFCRDLVTFKGILKEKDTETYNGLLWKLDILANYKELLEKNTNMSYLFFFKDFIPELFSMKYDDMDDIQRLSLLLQCFEEGTKQVDTVLHLEDPFDLLNEYKTMVIGNLHENFIMPIAQIIEKDLRIQVNSYLVNTKNPEPNPYKDPVRKVISILNLMNFKVFDKVIDIKQEIKEYFNELFYNLTAINMYDYQTYELFRNFASVKFNIELTHVHLPTRTMDQGPLDILNIVKRIAQFTKRFKYNILSQAFIEVDKEKKELFVVSIDQVSDSLQTHGLGVLNSIVNAIYQFLMKKFTNFSQFLLDDYVQNPLIRDIRWFKDNKEKLNGRYPLERAEKMGNEIKKLGVTSEGKNYLESFRELISVVGNALGLVRLVRSASINYCSRNLEYIPYLAFQSYSFEEQCKNVGLSNATIESSKHLDEIIKSFKERMKTSSEVNKTDKTKTTESNGINEQNTNNESNSNNESQSTDYLKMLVKRFETKLFETEISHLEAFFMIVPAVTLNYVESMLIAKEKLLKKNVTDAYLADDGFVLGLAYFLKLLGQNKRFNGLHWFEEIEQKYKTNIENLKKERQENEARKKEWEAAKKKKSKEKCNLS